jgi:2,5-diketo-D-gluconate reductase A
LPTTLTAEPTVTLNNGVAMPQLGFGVSEARDARASVAEALERGYRSIDTAEVYGNEDGVGAALAESGIPRDELFVTTKVWNGDHGRAHALRAAEASLERLGLDHVDLYLVHWPAREWAGCLQTWDALERLLEEGRTRAIGVSNFRLSHLQRVIGLGGTVPAVNQIELHPRLQQHDVRDTNARYGIVTEAWSPLGRGSTLDDPAIARIAERIGRTPAQVVLGWHLRHGRVVIPKSDTPARIAENRAAADVVLTDDDMRVLDGLHVAGDGGRIGPVPDDVRP